MNSMSTKNVQDPIEAAQVLITKMTTTPDARTNASFETLAGLLELARVERQHSCFDFAAEKGRYVVLLREKLKPLLSDAVDALEISVPAPHIVRERLGDALKAIETTLRGNP